MKQNIRKILIINTFGIGDVLFTTPLIANIKAHHPKISIGYICNSRTKELLISNPKIDRVHVYERDEFVRLRQRSLGVFLNRLKGFLNEIKTQRYDLVLDFSLNSSMGFFAWWLGIRHRFGFDFKGRGMFLNHRVPFKGYEDRHVIEYYQGLLAPLGIPVRVKSMELNITSADEAWAGDFARSKGIVFGRQPVIGLVPGGGASWGKDALYKRWPTEKYAKLADNFVEKSSAVIILFGDKNEVDLCHEVAARIARPPVIACGETTLGRFAALAKRCSLMVVNDGGPLHVSVAAGARTASIFGPVDDHVYGPYPRDQHLILKKDLACQPCYRRFRRASCDHVRCLQQLSVEEVFEKIQKTFFAATVV